MQIVLKLIKKNMGYLLRKVITTTKNSIESGSLFRRANRVKIGKSHEAKPKIVYFYVYHKFCYKITYFNAQKFPQLPLS
jgi:hypothetical protein